MPQYEVHFTNGQKMIITARKKPNNTALVKSVRRHREPMVMPMTSNQRKRLARKEQHDRRTDPNTIV